MYAYTGSVAVIDARRYPFLLDAWELLGRRYGVDPLLLASRRPELLEAGSARLLEAVKAGRVPKPRERLEEELGSFLYASMIAAVSGDRWLVSRLALAEAERAYELLRGEEDEVVARVAAAVGLRSARYGRPLYREPVALVGGVPVFMEYNFSLSFLEYVAVARRLLGADEWKPSNLPVLRGTIYLDKERFTRLLKEAIMNHVERYIASIRERLDPARAEELLASHVEAALKAARRRAPHGSQRGPGWIPSGVVVEDAFPPCMKDILERARRGEHLSHHERFAIATFMLNIGADIDTVVDIFRNMPDFKEKITRYQVEHLAGLRGSGKKYRTYSCEKMKTLGLCRADCGTRTPIQAYYRSLRSMRRRRGEDQREASEEKS